MKTSNETRQNILANRVCFMTCLFVIFGLVGCESEGEKTAQGRERAAEIVPENNQPMSEKVVKEIEEAKDSLMGGVETVEEYIEDSVITMKVKAAILNDSLLKASEIKVTTVDGIVALSGAVDSEQIVDKALKVASSQEHVKSVENNLTINEAATSY